MSDCRFVVTEQGLKSFIKSMVDERNNKLKKKQKLIMQQKKKSMEVKMSQIMKEERRRKVHNKTKKAFMSVLRDRKKLKLLKNRKASIRMQNNKVILKASRSVQVMETIQEKIKKNRRSPKKAKRVGIGNILSAKLKRYTFQDTDLASMGSPLRNSPRSRQSPLKTSRFQSPVKMSANEKRRKFLMRSASSDSTILTQEMIKKAGLSPCKEELAHRRKRAMLEIHNKRKKEQRFISSKVCKMAARIMKEKSDMSELRSMTQQIREDASSLLRPKKKPINGLKIKKKNFSIRSKELNLFFVNSSGGGGGGGGGGKHSYSKTVDLRNSNKFGNFGGGDLKKGFRLSTSKQRRRKNLKRMEISQFAKTGENFHVKKTDEEEDSVGVVIEESGLGRGFGSLGSAGQRYRSEKRPKKIFGGGMNSPPPDGVRGPRRGGNGMFGSGSERNPYEVLNFGAFVRKDFSNRSDLIEEISSAEGMSNGSQTLASLEI